MNQSRGRPQQGAARISASAGRKQGHAPPSGGFGRSPQDDAGEAAGGRGLSPGGPESGTGAGRFRLEGEEMASHEWIYWHVRPGPQGNRPHQQRYSQPRDLQQHPAGSDHPTEPFRIPCRRQRRGLLHPHDLLSRARCFRTACGRTHRIGGDSCTDGASMSRKADGSDSLHCNSSFVLIRLGLCSIIAKPMRLGEETRNTPR